MVMGPLVARRVCQAQGGAVGRGSIRLCHISVLSLTDGRTERSPTYPLTHHQSTRYTHAWVLGGGGSDSCDGDEEVHIGCGDGEGGDVVGVGRMMMLVMMMMVMGGIAGSGSRGWNESGCSDDWKAGKNWPTHCMRYIL